MPFIMYMTFLFYLPGSSSTNIHRIQGPPRYAPPPMGTNSPSPALGHPDGSGVPSSIGLDTNPLPPPMAGGFPPPPTAGICCFS